jgi:hypothetical protein
VDIPLEEVANKDKEDFNDFKENDLRI